MSATPDEPVRAGDDDFAEIVVAAELSQQGDESGVAVASVGERDSALSRHRYGLQVTAGCLLTFNLVFALLQSGTHPSEADASSL
jgi:hypothetical protein